MKTDGVIQADVIEELKWDPSITHEHIGVAVSDGVVTLSGTVPTYIERTAAEKAAQRVGGVKAVVEKIEVHVPGSGRRDDTDLAKAIVEQFRWHTQVPANLVKASVEKGWVQLSGEVEWEFQRRAAENAVRPLTGVAGISNRITIRARTADPGDIRSNIEQALKRAAEREATHLDIQVNGGEVILSGKVRSFAELRAVKGAASGTRGVTTVDDDSVKVAL